VIVRQSVKFSPESVKFSGRRSGGCGKFRKLQKFATANFRGDFRQFSGLFPPPGHSRKIGKISPGGKVGIFKRFSGNKQHTN
jgi:hypothetical protein